MAVAAASRDLRSHLFELMEQRRIPGLQAAIVRNGAMVRLEALGVANIEHDVPVTNASVFSINSIAQAFTGISLLQLVEANALNIDAAISTYVEGLPEAWGRVTSRQLATLSSGLPEIVSYGSGNSIGLIGVDEEAAWGAAFALPIEFEPGTDYAFTRTNYALLGKVIESLSGMDYTDFIRTRQFAVAGMTETRFSDDRDLISRRADSYSIVRPDGTSAEALYKSHMNWPPVLHPVSGLHSTAQDLARWLIALQAGTLLREQSSLETLWRPGMRSSGQWENWGIGWPVAQVEGHRVPAPAGGCKAQIALYPDGQAIVVLTNLIGAFPEQLAAYRDEAFDIGFMNELRTYC
ncbi:serine hydrolase [Sphingopyxis sp. JAI128]|uniref:serine hydrolase domain-containing protein n=1 Tax=Sphingopyxis sp. JAI128 TaxID=2723066 RepID=UPI001608A230|nr:serine hydrolase domain-containing protein [Sphingopyxis sp. JAI128]MBB6427882.1 CubicO group peptidase (beta-lactamase class C family) [Sphingopyxis sp. JAI128]